MTLVEAVVLGVVQGLTEFLPVSSTAHLRIIPTLLGWKDPGAGFSAVIQCGTLVAVLAAMRRDVATLIHGLMVGVRSGRPLAHPESRTAILIVLGTLPIVVAGFLGRDLIRTQFRDLHVVTLALLAATGLMTAAEAACLWRARHGRPGRGGLTGIRIVDGVTMGLAQVLALIPGVSRSGATISSGMLTGLDRGTAARFSFLLSLPAVAAAGLLEAWQQRREIFGTTADAGATLLGTLAACVVGYISIRWLLRLLTSHTLWPFIIYRLGLAALLAALLRAGLVPAAG